MLPEGNSHHSLKGLSKADAYKEMLSQAEAVMHGERNYIANLANVAAIIYHGLNGRDEAPVNWAGFYLTDTSKPHGELVLGPFQGKVACVRIRFGRGVCGTAAQSQTTQLVPNVHEFPGHIACDSASNSEVVVPMVLNKRVYGVLDLDSSVLNGFDSEDQRGLEAIVAALMSGCDLPQ